MIACDFLHVDTILLRKLYVLVFIHHDSRLVRIAGGTATPSANRVTQQARNPSTDLADQANTVNFLIRDRDTKFTASLDAVFTAQGTRIITSPTRAPRANAISRPCSPSTALLQLPPAPPRPGPACALRARHASRAHRRRRPHQLRNTDHPGGPIHEYRTAA